ncbi:hypothetical protein [Kiloniella antarctica]|jgi:hypothetical protein|uniref:Heme exporter protein D n=1 Tax=Kiloniella antarctica TaxID=1550907 RepID=A0ABW5BHE6_9PROT
MIDYIKGDSMDKVIGVTAVSTPLWLHHFNMGVAVILGIGGIALLALRIAKARQEYLKSKEERVTNETA